MGWSIKTNNKDKWSVFSSVTDSIIATFKTEKELVNFIAREQVYKGKLKAIEELISFPSGWTVNDERLFDREETKQYYDWHLSLLSKGITYEEYYKAIDDKLQELMQ